MEIVGEIIRIDPVQEISDRFRKRDFYLSIEGRFPEIIKFQVTQDYCEALDALLVGDSVKTHFNLKGKFYTNREGKKYHFNNLHCWRFELLDANGTATQPNYEDEDDDELPF